MLKVGLTDFNGLVVTSRGKSQGDFVLFGPPSRVLKGSCQVLWFEVGIEAEDFNMAGAGGDESEDRSDGDPHAANARFAAHDRRIHGDALIFKESHVGRVAVIQWDVEMPYAGMGMRP